MNGIDITTAMPPFVLFYIDRSRIRAGKGVRAIQPAEWVNWNGKPGAVNCKGSFYAGLSQCWPTEKEALAVARAIIQEESDLEAARYAAITARLKAAHSAVLTAFRNLTEETPA